MPGMYDDEPMGAVNRLRRRYEEDDLNEYDEGFGVDADADLMNPVMEGQEEDKESYEGNRPNSIGEAYMDDMVEYDEDGYPLESPEMASEGLDEPGSLFDSYSEPEEQEGTAEAARTLLLDRAKRKQALSSGFQDKVAQFNKGTM